MLRTNALAAGLLLGGLLGLPGLLDGLEVVPPTRALDGE